MILGKWREMIGDEILIRHPVSHLLHVPFDTVDIVLQR